MKTAAVPAAAVAVEEAAEAAVEAAEEAAAEVFRYGSYPSWACSTRCGWHPGLNPISFNY
jgi:hypothetical protein